MIKKLKDYYHNYKFVYYLLYFPVNIWKKYQIIKNNRLDDEKFIKIKYKKEVGKDLNLKDPKLFTEKIQWLKLNDRRDLYTQCADKYLVRKYIEKKVGKEYLIPSIFVTENYKNICKNNIPDYPVIVKTTHDSGGTFVIENKNKYNFKKLQKELKKRLKNNYYYLNREWEYKNIKPRIIVEKFLKDKTGNKLLNDYKIHCFNGNPMFIQTIFDRGEDTKENWYDTKWNPIDVYYFSPHKKNIKKPEVLNELLDVSKKLSQDFPYVRVDLYIVNNKIYFGELTFRPYGGFIKFVPESFDEELGKYLNLKINN